MTDYTQQIVIHCQPELLSIIHDNDLDWSYSETQTNEVDVFIPYTKKVEQINNELVEESDFCDYFGLDYNYVNCIELLP